MGKLLGSHQALELALEWATRRLAPSLLCIPQRPAIDIYRSDLRQSCNAYLYLFMHLGVTI